MSLFDLLIVQPIFNVLILIYGLLPGGDFGVSVILFTILIRLLMWPLVKKQLHQTKVMRKLQPELKKIKAKTKGNKQLEAQLMMELYREKGVNPFSSIGLLLVQLPIFIALFQVITIVTSQRDRIGQFTYAPLESLAPIRDIIQNPEGFNETLFNIVNLAERAISSSGLNIPIIILALLAAVLQYFQAKQVSPQPQDGKRLRDMLKEQAAGKEVDQSEVTAAVSSKMLTVLPLITFLVMLYLPGALVLYTVVQSFVAVIQQHLILNRDAEEMDDIADKKTISKSKKSSDVKVRYGKAQEAEIVEKIDEPEAQTTTLPKKKTPSKKKRKRR